MPKHCEPGWARREGFGLVMLAPRRPPPPLPVDIGPVSRVHQADDGVINVSFEHHAVDKLWLAANNAWKHRRWLTGFAGEPRIRRHPDKYHPLAFSDWISANANPLRIHLLIIHKGRNRSAASISPKTPAMIGALDRLT